jgi:carbonic anhydrase
MSSRPSTFAAHSSTRRSSPSSSTTSPAPVTLENTGNTVIVHVDPGSYIVAGGVRYDLVQFHFHHPGEEAVKGKLTDMDIHLVHKSADGKQAVVAIRLSEDITTPPNAVLAELWPHLPTKSRRNGESHGYGESRRPAARRPRLLDLHGLAHRAALHRRRALVHLRAGDDPEPRPVARLCRPLFKVNSRPLQDLHGRRIEADE